MPELKNSFSGGKMEKDLDERIVPSNQYREALNIAVSTSEDSDVGAAQNILGNIKVTEAIAGPGKDYLLDGDLCSVTDLGVGEFRYYGTNEHVAHTVDAQTDKLYRFISTTPNSHNNHGVWMDRIVEYNTRSKVQDPWTVKEKSVSVDIYKVATKIVSLDVIAEPPVTKYECIDEWCTPCPGGICSGMSYSNPQCDYNCQEYAGPVVSVSAPCNKTRIQVCINSLQLRWGMTIRVNGQVPINVDGLAIEPVIESISYNGYMATLTLSENIDAGLSVGQDITLHGDRALNFRSDRNITGINIIDDMLFWTDNYSEPKKVNIERSKIGSESWEYGSGFDGVSTPPIIWEGFGNACSGSANTACYSDFDQHTKLIVEEEHKMDCEKSTLACPIPGCTNPLATNYNPLATVDDGSCIIPPPPVYGCPAYEATNGACNAGPAYFPGMTADDLMLCVYPGYCETCETGLTPPNYNVVWETDNPNCVACIDPTANNYDPNATRDCSGITSGTDYDCCWYCMDPAAINYNAAALYDCAGNSSNIDTSCCNYTPVPPSWDCSGANGNVNMATPWTCYDPGTGNGVYTTLLACQGGCTPVLPVPGCMNPTAFNYDPLATVDDGSCIWDGADCTNCNFNPGIVLAYDQVQGWTGDPDNAYVPTMTDLYNGPSNVPTWDPYKLNGGTHGYGIAVNDVPQDREYGYYKFANDYYGINTQGFENLPYNLVPNHNLHRTLKSPSGVIAGNQFYWKPQWFGVVGGTWGKNSPFDTWDGESLPMGHDGSFPLPPKCQLGNPLNKAFYHFKHSVTGSGILDSNGDDINTYGVYGTLWGQNPNNNAPPASLDWTECGLAVDQDTKHQTGSILSNSPTVMFGCWGDFIKYVNAIFEYCSQITNCANYLVAANATGSTPSDPLQFTVNQDFETVKKQLDPLINPTKRPYSGPTSNIGNKTNMGGTGYSTCQANIGLWMANNLIDPLQTSSWTQIGNFPPYSTNNPLGNEWYRLHGGEAYPYVFGPELQAGFDACQCGDGYGNPPSVWCTPTGGTIPSTPGYCPDCNDTPPCAPGARGLFSIQLCVNGPTGQTATDGDITLTVTGGAAPLTYAWATTGLVGGGVNGSTIAGPFYNIGMGTVTVTVTDVNNVVRTITMTILQSVGNPECITVNTSPIGPPSPY